MSRPPTRKDILPSCPFGENPSIHTRLETFYFFLSSMFFGLPLEGPSPLSLVVQGIDTSRNQTNSLSFPSHTNLGPLVSPFPILYCRFFTRRCLTRSFLQVTKKALMLFVSDLPKLVQKQDETKLYRDLVYV